MHATTKILALVLVFAEIEGALQPKNRTQVKAGAPKKRSNQRMSTIEDVLVSSRDLKGGQRGTAAGYDVAQGYNYPGGYNYVAVGADGAAEVAFKIDLSLFMQRLNMIPELGQIVGALVQKVEALVFRLGQGAPGGDGFKGLIVALEKSIIARLDQQDMKINSLFQLIRQLQGETGTLSQGVNQILAILQNMGGNTGGGADRFCAQEMATIEGMLRQMMTTLAQVVEVVTVISRPSKGTGNSSRYILESVQANYAVLRQLSTMIEGIGQQVDRGFSCAQVGTGGSAVERQILQTVSSVVTLIQNLPQQVLAVLQNSGLLGGSSGSITSYVQKVMETCGTIISEVITVRDTLIGARQELRRHFAESRKHLVAVKKVVTESTEMVSSAAAAISVGSRMKCPTNKHQTPDLDD